MNIKGTLITFLSILLLLSVHNSALQLTMSSYEHLASSAQLSTLMKQQLAFETSINSLIKNVTSVQSSVGATTNVTAKISLLQSAIAS